MQFTAYESMKGMGKQILKYLTEMIYSGKIVYTLFFIEGDGWWKFCITNTIVIILNCIPFFANFFRSGG